MAKERSYSDWLKNEFGGLVDELGIDQQRKRFLKSRWLDQVIWTEGKAHQARNRYYLLRLTTIVGALLVPALVSLNPSDETLDDAVRIATWVVSLIVAASAAIEQFFHFGDRWRNYRRTAERLKAEGWLYLQLSGPYASNSATHETAYSAFAIRVEELLQADVDAYLTEVTVEKKKNEKKQSEEASPSR
jgi:Protein of unknown function (DUF4231)